MTKMPILLFAAGLGTRMGALTRDKPKPLVSVGGKALIDHALDLIDPNEIGNCVVNLHYKGAMLRDHLRGRDVLFSDESGMLLETGGGLRHALAQLGSDVVCTLNTDAVWRGANPISQLLAAWRPEMEALLLTVPPAHAVGHKGHGDFLHDVDGRLTRGAGNIYSGLQIVRTDDLVNIAQDAFSMNVLWDRIAARGGLFGHVYDGQWCDVGQPESIALAEAMLEQSDV